MTSTSAKRSKYRNVRTILDGITFDSKKEAVRYADLKLLEKAGLIRDLELQPRIPLICNGVKIGSYVGDFAYSERGIRIIEDVKSPATKTPVYNLKKKILATYSPPIHIKEVF